MKLLDVVCAPWAILPDKLCEIRDIYATHLRGEKIDIEAVEARIGRPLANEPREYEVIDGVAVLGLDGVIAQRANLFTRVSGGTSSQLFARDVKSAAEDPSVTAIVVNTDSPGGTVAGIESAAAVVHEAAMKKPIVAFTDGVMASGAYWIGSAADRIFISGKTTTVGSIGVVATHVDVSRAEEKAGVKTTEIVAGKYKRIASQYGELTKEGRAVMQDQVDRLYGAFVEDVARYRGVSVEQVLADMADGRIFIGTQAIEAGLVDGVSSLDALIADLAAGRYVVRRTQVTSAGAALSPDPTTGVVMANANANEMTREKFVAEHPAIAQAIREEAVAAAAAGLRAEGALAERTRIQQIEAQLMPGHEVLINTLKYDGKTTGPEAAVQVLAAERAFLEKRAEQQDRDAPPALPGAASPTGLPPAPKKDNPDAALTVEERCKKTWESDASVRNEFTSLEAFTAFEKAQADGRVKVLGAKR